MVKRMALVSAGGLVLNLLAISEQEAAKTTLSNGERLVDWAEGCEIGGTWDGRAFTRKAPEPPPSEPEWKQVYAALEARVAALEQRR